MPLPRQVNPMTKFSSKTAHELERHCYKLLETCRLTLLEVEEHAILILLHETWRRNGFYKNLPKLEREQASYLEYRARRIRRSLLGKAYTCRREVERILAVLEWGTVGSEKFFKRRG